MSNVPQFAAGELVNLTITGARYVETSDSGDGRPEFAFDLPGLVEPLFLPAHAAIRYERVVPAEWPPQPGDIWADRNRAEWITTASDGETILMRVIDSDSDAVDALDVLREDGPMKLLRRRGWTPAADTAPAAPEQVNERAAYVAGLRRIADLIESRTDLPVPYGNAGQIEFRTREELERVAAEFDVKLRNGDTHDRGEVWFGGAYLNLCWFYPRPPEVELTDAQLDAAEAEPDEPPADCECDDCVAEDEATEPLPHRVPDGERMSLDEALADAEKHGHLAATS